MYTLHTLAHTHTYIPSHEHVHTHTVVIKSPKLHDTPSARGIAMHCKLLAAPFFFLSLCPFKGLWTVTTQINFHHLSNNNHLEQSNKRKRILF